MMRRGESADRERVLKTVCIVGVVLLLDQISKVWVTGSMEVGESLTILGSFFRLTYVQNPGGVFGLTLGGAGFHLLLSGVALILVGVLLWRAAGDDRGSVTGLALVLGGAIGNLADRVRFGLVIDFLDFGIGAVRWWVFNLADFSVTTGVLALIARSFSRGEKEAAREDGSSPGGQG